MEVIFVTFGNGLKSNYSSNQSNSIGSALKFIGIALLLMGLISAFVTGNSDDFPRDLKTTVVIFTLITSVIQCALFFGFSEIIFLLEDIKKQK